MTIRLALLDSQPERFPAGVVITTHQIVATIHGRDRVIDYPNCQKQAEERLAAWKEKNPDVAIRIVS